MVWDVEKYKTDKLNYNYIIEISISVAMIIIILLVLFFPRLSVFEKESIEYFEGAAKLDHTPITIQDAANSKAKKSKAIPPAAIFVPVDYEVILEELVLDEDYTMEEVAESGDKIDSEGTGDEPLAFSSLPYLPRQIVEVIPANIDNLEGRIKFSLLIGKNGKVLEHKILRNTLSEQKSLKFIIDAVYKSKWMPINFDGHYVEYWFEKTYSFND